MFSLLTTNPVAMLIATIGFWDATVTVRDGYTGVVTRAEQIERYIEPGTGYRIPLLERVVRLPSVARPGANIEHTARLLNGSSCDFVLSHSYIVEDMEGAVKALQYRKKRYLEPQLIEAQLRTEIDDIINQTAIADLNRDFEDKLERNLFDRIKKVYPDGTKPTHLSIQSFECADPEAALATKIYRRPKFAPSSTKPFNALTGCGETDGRAKRLRRDGWPSQTIADGHHPSFHNERDTGHNTRPGHSLSAYRSSD